MSKEEKVTKGVSEGNEECSIHLSCSIEETNKLRKKLGLAPLRVDKSPKINVKDTLVTTEEKEKEDEDDIGWKVREKLLKEGAQTQLGDEDDLNLLNWISRSRALDAQKKNKKGLLLNLTEEEEDDNNENDTPKDEDGNYMDLRIVHDTSSFHHLKPGSDIVLTLEDSKIINSKGQLEEGNGFLQNEDILKEERKKKNCKSQLYNPVDPNTIDHQDSVNATKNKNDILSLYDEWGETDGGLCLSSRKNNTEKYPKLSEICETKECVNKDRPYVSLESKTCIQRDYMNEQEVARYHMQCHEAKFTSSQRNKCLVKMMKRKRKKDTTSKKEETQEETETTFLSPLLHNTKNLPIVLGSDDVDLENTFLYAQLSRQLPKLSQTIEETNQAMSSKKLLTSQSCRTREDPAHSVFKNVQHCEKKKKYSNYVEQEDELSKQQEESKNKVEFSDITEFCRTLETPFEKMASFKKESTSPSHPSSVSKEHTISPELSPCELQQKHHSSDSCYSTVQNEISEKDKAIVQNVLVEEVLDGGLVSALKFLKSRGNILTKEIPGDLEQDTHRRRKKNENVLLHMSANPNDIKLEYKDEYGRVMTPKEAFRYISWVFHGKGPGKKKREKFLKKMELEKKLKGVLSNPSQLLTMRALRKQQKTGQAHIVLSRKT